MGSDRSYTQSIALHHWPHHQSPCTKGLIINRLLAPRVRAPPLQPHNQPPCTNGAGASTSATLGQVSMHAPPLPVNPVKARALGQCRFLSPEGDRLRRPVSLPVKEARQCRFLSRRTCGEPVHRRTASGWVSHSVRVLLASCIRCMSGLQLKPRSAPPSDLLGKVGALRAGRSRCAQP